MFSSKIRKESKAELKSAVENQKRVADDLNYEVQSLYDTRKVLQSKTSHAFEFINSIKNTPESINLTINEIKVNINNYKQLLDAAEVEYKKANIKVGGGTAAGVAAGVGVATLAPTAIVGLVSVFGTASTGTAIAALSGAAATNATLAAIGGGALVAGGTGVAGGEALLALAGPVGWAIGGSALLAGGILANGKNKKAAEQMFKQANEINATAKTQKAMKYEIKKMTDMTNSDGRDIDNRMIIVKGFPNDYNKMDNSQIEMLGAFVNNVHAAAKHLNMILGDNGKFSSPKGTD